MKTLSTPIDNPMDAPRIAKFEVVDVVDNDTAEVPHIGVSIRLYGPGNVPYGDRFVLTAYDSQASTCLEVNSLQQNYGDLVRLYGATVTGAYTTLSTAYNANVANPTKRKRCLAVEAALPGLLLSSAFAVLA